MNLPLWLVYEHLCHLHHCRRTHRPATNSHPNTHHPHHLSFYYIELLEQKVDLTATPRFATPEPSRTDPNTPSALASTAQLLDAKTPGGASIDALPATPMVSVQREFCWLTNPAPPAVEVIDGRTILVEIGRTMQYGCEARRRALNGEGGNEFMTYQLEVRDGPNGSPPLTYYTASPTPLHR